MGVLVPGEDDLRELCWRDLSMRVFSVRMKDELAATTGDWTVGRRGGSKDILQENNHERVRME